MKPSEAITIRLASVDESHIVAELVGRLIDELTDGSGDAARDGELAAAARGLLAEGRFEAFLAFDGGDGAVGLLTLSECGAVYALGRFGEIAEFYVAPELRSSGLGARMVAAAVDHARMRGWRRLEVGAPDLPRWQRTVDFYKRCGFTEVGPRLKLPLT